MPRLFGNACTTKLPHGDYYTNGCGKLNDFTPERLQAIKDLGCTHIWYIGVLDHATKTAFNDLLKGNHGAIVKGEAGSPYAVRDYYGIAPSLAVDIDRRMEEFDALVKRTHEAGMGVIIDFVPNHLSRQYCSHTKPSYVHDFGADDNTTVAFAPNNNFYYFPGQTLSLPFGDECEDFSFSEFPAKATGNNLFCATPSKDDWYETVKLNYGIDLMGDWGTYYDPLPDTWLKMMDILSFWASKGVDGFRCDMAELVPTEFWTWAIGKLRKAYPDILFIGEIYRPDRYLEFIHSGFDYLYDKIGLYDLLIQVLKGNATTSQIGHVLFSQEAYKEYLIRFMENHDEQRIASDFITGDGERAFPAMCLTALIDGNPLMTLFAQELGERGMESEGFSGLDGRTSIFDYWSVDSMRQWLQDCGQKHPLRERYKKLLHLASSPVFAEGAFYDLTYLDSSFSQRGLFVFLRAIFSKFALVVINFGEASQEVSVPIPRHAFDTLSLPNPLSAMVGNLDSFECHDVDFTPDSHYVLQAKGYGATIHLFTIKRP